MVTLEELSEILAEVRTIAVVGASRKEEKAGHTIPKYLKDQGYTIIPVNPNADTLFGEPAMDALEELGAPVDMVLVFRRPEHAVEVARDTVTNGARVLWFQPMTSSDEGIDVACAAGLRVVSEACAGVVHRMVNAAVVR